jgi:hypothetical protein
MDKRHEIEVQKEMELEAAKSSFLEHFSDLRPDLYFPDEWTDEERDMVLEELRPSKTKTSMFSSIPMKCKARSCTFADTCPLQQKNIAPQGKPCPIEMAMIRQFTEDYITELNVDPNNLVEVSMIRDLVDQEVQYIRKSKLLAKEDFIQENVIGISPQGEALMSKQLHLAVDLEDKLHKRKRDLRNSLMATREARAKIGQGNIDTAQALSTIFEEVRAVEIEKEKLLKKKLGTFEEDEYIETQIKGKTDEG